MLDDYLFTYPCWEWSETMLVKGGTGVYAYMRLCATSYRVDYMYDVTNSGVEDFVASSGYLECGWLIIP